MKLLHEWLVPGQVRPQLHPGTARKGLELLRSDDATVVPIDVGRASMGLQLEGDDPPGLGKGRQDLSKRGADRRQSAVEQYQRLSRAVDLVVHSEAVHLSVAARLWDLGVAGRHKGCSSYSVWHHLVAAYGNARSS